jgi:hypothetical protein
MTDTTDTTPEAAPAPPPGAGRWKLIAGLAAGAAVLAVGITAFAVTRDDDNDPAQTAATQQIAAARQACQQWLDNGSASAGSGPGADWCDDMAGWMTDNMANGQMMRGPMMWDSPEAMRDVCTQAMGTGQTANGDPAQWCDQMAGWMSQHMGDWDNWDNYWND